MGSVKESAERWRDLCEIARNEKDPAKLLELTAEINRLLTVKLEKHTPDSAGGEKSSRKSA